MYVAFLVFWGGLWPSFFQIAKLLAFKDKGFQTLLYQKTSRMTCKLKQTLKQIFSVNAKNFA